MLSSVVVAIVQVTSGCGPRLADADLDGVPEIGEVSGPLAHLAWLAGGWRSEEGSRTVEEWWTAPAGGTMFGTNHTYRADTTIAFERLRIEARGDRSVLFAQPDPELPPIAFSEVERTTDRIAFENPDHDYPQRIEYWMAEDGSLHGRISGTITQESGETRQERYEWVWLPL
jgi:hypothetical protein